VVAKYVTLTYEAHHFPLVSVVDAIVVIVIVIIVA